MIASLFRFAALPFLIFISALFVGQRCCADKGDKFLHVQHTTSQGAAEHRYFTVTQTDDELNKGYRVGPYTVSPTEPETADKRYVLQFLHADSGITVHLGELVQPEQPLQPGVQNGEDEKEEMVSGFHLGIDQITGNYTLQWFDDKGQQAGAPVPLTASSEGKAKLTILRDSPDDAGTMIDPSVAFSLLFSRHQKGQKNKDADSDLAAALQTMSLEASWNPEDMIIEVDAGNTDWGLLKENDGTRKSSTPSQGLSCRFKALHQRACPPAAPEVQAQVSVNTTDTNDGARGFSISQGMFLLLSLLLSSSGSNRCPT